MRLISLFLVAALALAACAAPAQLESVRWHGVLIRTPDVARSVEFYDRVLAYDESATWASGRLVRLTGDDPIYLEQTAHPVQAPAPLDEARAAIAFRVIDLDASIQSMRALGVELVNPEPFAVGVGAAIRFRDADGNVHSLLQTAQPPQPPFVEPAMYNSGFKLPDSDTAFVRELVASLGFEVMTERYYPPSLPLLHGDRSFAFMVHENEREEPEIRPRSSISTQQNGTVLVLVTDDIAATRRRVARHVGGAVGAVDAISRFPLGRRFAFTTRSGVPTEVWQLSE
jgi:predicted enzyme related to lactoylglutathione lyase